MTQCALVFVAKSACPSNANDRLGIYFHADAVRTPSAITRATDPVRGAGYNHGNESQLHVFLFEVAGIDTEIIAASVRNPIHVTDCALAGADIATVPYKVIEQMTHHPLTDAGIEKFQADYKAVFGE